VIAATPAKPRQQFKAIQDQRLKLRSIPAKSFAIFGSLDENQMLGTK
jgi:hypothetical protein